MTTESRKPGVLENSELDQMNGGGIDMIIKVSTLPGESSFSYELIGQPDIGTGAKSSTDSVRSKEASLGYTKVERIK